MYRILKKNFGIQRICARWVPRLLKDKHKQRRVSTSRAFLQKWRSGSNAFLDCIITSDETWLHYYDPETEQQSSVWKSSILEFQLLQLLVHPPYSQDLAPMDFPLSNYHNFTRKKNCFFKPMWKILHHPHWSSYHSQNFSISRSWIFMSLKNLILSSQPNISCGYSKEPSQWDCSFEHPEHMFKLIDKKIIIILR